MVRSLRMLLQIYSRNNIYFYIFIIIHFFNISIFFISELDSKKQINRKDTNLKKQLNYSEYVERMHLLSQNKRNLIAHQKKDYCDYIPDILKSQGLPIIHSPVKTGKKFEGLHKK